MDNSKIGAAKKRGGGSRRKTSNNNKTSNINKSEEEGGQIQNDNNDNGEKLQHDQNQHQSNSQPNRIQQRSSPQKTESQQNMNNTNNQNTNQQHNRRPKQNNNNSNNNSNNNQRSQNSDQSPNKNTNNTNNNNRNNNNNNNTKNRPIPLNDFLNNNNNNNTGSRSSGGNNAVDDFLSAKRLELLAQNENVTYYTLLAFAYENFTTPKLQDTFRPHNPRCPFTLRHAFEVERKLEVFFPTYFSSRSVVTLYELEQDLIKFAQDEKFGNNLAGLNIANLLTVVKIQRHFDIPDTVKQIPMVTTTEVVGALRTVGYVQRRKNKRSKERQQVNPIDVVMELAKVKGVQKPTELCVKLDKLGFYFQLLSALDRQQNELRNKIEQRLKQEMMDSYNSGAYDESEMKKLRNMEVSLRKKAKNILETWRKRTAEMVTEPAVRAFLTRAVNTLFAESKSSNDHNGLVAAICAILLFHKNGESKTEEKSYEKIVALTRMYLEQKQFGGELLNVGSLANIEQQVEDSFGTKNFSSLGFGSFLSFVAREIDTELLSFSSSSSSSKSGAGGSDKNKKIGTDRVSLVGNLPTIEEIIDFVQQCNSSGDGSNGNGIERASKRLCEYYQLGSVEQLGFKDFAALQKQINYTMENNPLKSTNVYYQHAMVSDSTLEDVSENNNNTNSKAGVLGWIPEEEVIQALLETPYLVDVKISTQWKLVFEPTYNDFKKFIQTNAGKLTDFIVMETEHDHFVRIDPRASVDRFSHAVNNSSANHTAVQLVSLIAMNKGVENSSLSLLANFMRSGLSKLAVGDSTARVCDFILSVLILIPDLMRSVVFKPVFLEPLQQVIKDKDCYTCLLEYATQNNNNSRGFISVLHDIGLRLQIDTFVKHWRSTRGINNASSSINNNNNTSSATYHEKNKKMSEHEYNQQLLKDTVTKVSNTTLITPEPKSNEAVIANNNTDNSNNNNDVKIKTEEEVINNREEGVESAVITEVVENKELESAMEELEYDPIKAREIINEFVKREFGKGLEIDSQGAEIIRKQHERAGRALTRLSHELYSNETHFVLELVQNADDNKYNVDTPALEFVIRNDRIEVNNNEIGFSPANILALCDIGKSTKPKNIAGFIGKKGIGFKSVFSVTDAPEIHSCGFHVRLDISKEESYGYPLPEYLDQDLNEPSQDNSITTITQEQGEEEGKQEEGEVGEVEEGEEGGEEEEEEDGEKDKEIATKWNTRIVLPLKDLYRDESHMQVLTGKFKKIKPSLLLFLHRLRKIAVRDTVNESRKIMTKTKIGKDILQVESSNGSTQRWLLVKDKTLVEAGVRDDVESTEIILAFPLFEKDSMETERIAEQYLFAFLPVRSYGFRFIIQADFNMPSSREDILADDGWNQWLKSKISTLFMKAVDRFKSLFEDITKPGANVNDELLISTALQFYNFVPIEGEVTGFFASVVREIHQLMKASECIPCQSINDNEKNNDNTNEINKNNKSKNNKNKKERKGNNKSKKRQKDPSPSDDILNNNNNNNNNNMEGVKWVRPCDVLIPPNDERLLKLVPNRLLHKYLGLHFLHPKITSLHQGVRQNLGIAIFSSSHLIKLIDAVCQDPVNRDVNNTTHWKWVASCLAYLSSVRENDSIKAQENRKMLNSICILPVTNGKIVSANSGIVFFPPSSDEDQVKTLRHFESELSIIHTNLLKALPEVADEADAGIDARGLRLMLVRLEVKRLIPQDVIQQHILPVFTSNESIQTKTKEVLAAYLTYIKDQIITSETTQPQKLTGWQNEVVDKIKDCAVIWCKTSGSEEAVLRKGIEVHLGPEYKNPCDLQKIYPEVQWFILDPIYLNLNSTKASAAEVNEWRLFLVQFLNVWEFVSVVPKDENDWDSPQLNIIITNLEVKQDQAVLSKARTTVELMDLNWDSTYSKYGSRTTTTTGTNSNLPSSFGQLIRNKEWIPSTFGTLCKGQDLFNPENNSITALFLNQNIPYLSARLTSANFMNFVGVVDDLNVETVLRVLQNWAVEDEELLSMKRKRRRFSAAYMRNIYEYLFHNGRDVVGMRTIINTWFNHSKLIYIPEATNAEKDTNSSSSTSSAGGIEDVEAENENGTQRFYGVNEAAWVDPSFILNSRGYRVLAPYYSTLYAPNPSSSNSNYNSKTYNKSYKVKRQKNKFR
eukprot:TRINITY_DN890_c0_g1_i2.p1 TRINITY_DN890_c0_g1~~TRINITY_DN890_c0_g1_i2.p1  ORF type:complete len:2146 (+),score=649.66 TRINITY_DN890_c0_g1_i2:669-7106(+)